jgi:hypothetical protein
MGGLRYVPKEKHKDPFQRGRKGALCPPAAEMPADMAQKLLESSDPDPRAKQVERWATDGRLAYCGRPYDRKKKSEWYGFPVGWFRVPDRLRRKWIREGLAERATMYLFWRDEDLP